MADEPDDGGTRYSLVLPFWIDTDAYSQRDRNMFCAGYEFNSVIFLLKHEQGEANCTILRENESRVRLAAAKLLREIEITCCDEKDDPDGTYSYLTIDAR